MGGIEGDEGDEEGTPASDDAAPAPSAGSAGLLWPVRLDGAPSALRRLTRDELVSTLEVLTGTAPARDDLPEEQRSDHGPLLTSGMSFIGPEIGKLKQVMSDFAVRVTPAMLVKTGCASTQQTQRDCLLAWSLRFAEQAFRRPPGTGESAIYQRILASADGTKDGNTIALEGVLTGIFFSPSFLYRTEIGAAVAGKAGLRALDSNDLAVRLSYLATLAPPDAELLDAAKTGRLKDGGERGRQFARLAASDRGKRALAVLVFEWLGANERKVHEKSQKYLTGLGADFEPSVRASAEAAIRKVVLDSADPTVGGLLSTDAYLADAPIQKIRQAFGTGKTASGDTAETGRAGLMMHPHVLAGHTKDDGASPFQIGVFMREAFLCEPIPSPPPGAADMARDGVPPGSTMRESLEYRTGAGLCQGCHQHFAPMGYSFMPFDPVGRWVKQDPTGKPWDLSGSITPASGSAFSFKTPGELMRGLASLPQVHGCFAQTALELAFGRHLVTEDQEMLVALNDAVKKTRGGVAAIFQTIVSAPSFANTIASR